MHLRTPSIDQGKQAGLWAIFFLLLLWVGDAGGRRLERHGVHPLASFGLRDLSLRARARRLMRG